MWHETHAVGERSNRVGGASRCNILVLNISIFFAVPSLVCVVHQLGRGSFISSVVVCAASAPLLLPAFRAQSSWRAAAGLLATTELQFACRAECKKICLPGLLCELLRFVQV